MRIPAVPGWSRHPADAAHLLAASLVLGGGTALLAAYPVGVRNVTTDLVRLAHRLPAVVQQGLLGVVQAGAVITPLVLLVLVFRWRRPGQAALAAGAGVVAGVAVSAMQGWLDRAAPQSPAGSLSFNSWITGAAFPSAAYLAGLAAAVTVLSPSMSRPWRRAAWLWVGALCLVRILTTLAVPVQLVTVLALGVAVGSAGLVALGAPARRLDLGQIFSALTAAGVAVDGLEPTAERPGISRTLRGAVDTQPVMVSVVGFEERDADLLLRAVRAVLVKGASDERPGWSPLHVVEHEALCSMMATTAGARAPDVLAVAESSGGDGLLVTRAPCSRRVADLPDCELQGPLLRDCWGQLEALQEHGIAHRQANLEHFGLDGRGRVHIDGFRAGTLGASPQLLGTDVAELLVAQAARVGVGPAVAAAMESVPRERLEAALPLIQPLAMSGPTRSEVRARAGKALWSDVRDRLQQELGTEPVELAELQRLSLGRLVSAFGLTVFVYVILAFVSNWSDISHALGEADWAYLPGLLFLSAAGFVGGAWSLMGAVPLELPFVETVQVMFAQSFLNHFTPANAGGMALRNRYLQARGLDFALSAAGVGLTSAASGVVQVVLIAAFAAWASSAGDFGFQLPKAAGLAEIVLLVLLVTGVVWLLPPGRRMLRKLGSGVWKAARQVVALAKDPSKMLLLFGGAAVGKLTLILAFSQSCRAFGIHGLSFAQLGFAYMTANTVASAAPTPGGTGAIEAGLVAVLTGMGVDPATALSTVLVFRVITYWLPVPPAWYFLRRLRKVGVV